MEEKIEKILLSHIEAVTEKNSPFVPTAINGVPQSAKEIASHFREFMEWFILDAYEKFGFDEEEYNHRLTWYNIEENKDYTLDELYNYWLKEVKK